MINRLVSLNIPFVYIQDSRPDDIIPKPPVSGKLRREAINTIETTFLDMKNKMNLDGSFTIEQANVKLTQIVRNIMGELKRNKELMTLLADVYTYTYDDYIFTHSFNVTLYTLAIGVELNINNKNLEKFLGLERFYMMSAKRSCLWKSSGNPVS
jgi:hypothetical protein